MQTAMADPLNERLQKLVNLGVPGIDIMHGELKVLMLEAEQELTLAQEREEETEEAMDSMERKYWEGQLDALSHLYSLTYDISFAEGLIRENRKDGHL
jgi:hypothetical protein